MPNIRELDAPEGLGLRPSDLGPDATAAAARRIGSFYSATADSLADTGNRIASTIRDAGDVAVKFEDHQQISHGAAAGTQLADNLNTAWRTLVNGGKDADGNVIPPADPNDPSVRGKFMEETVEPALEQFQSSFTTENSQRFGEQFANNLRQHLSTVTAADQSTLSGIAAKRNGVTTINNLANMVRADPSSIDFAMSQLDHSLDGIAGSSPTMDAVTSARVKSDLMQDGGQTIVQSYLYGVADKNPSQVKAILDSGKFSKYLDPSTTNQILNYARTTDRLNQSTADTARELQDRANKQAFDRKVIDLEASTLPDDPSQKPSLPSNYFGQLKQIAGMPGADLGKVRAMVSDGDRLVSRLNKPEPAATMSARNAMDIMTRMQATDDTHVDGERAANEAYGAGQITSTDRNMLVKEWRESRTGDGQSLAQAKDAFLKSVEPMINKPLQDIGDDTAKLRMYRFTVDVNKAVDAYRAQGKNARDLFDPSNPAFLGRPEFVNKPEYQGSMQANLPAMAARPSINLTGPGNDVVSYSAPEPMPIPKRQPGETLDAWMTRTGRGFMPHHAPAGPSAPVSQ